MEFKNTFDLYNEYKSKSFIYDGIESNIREDNELIEDVRLQSLIPDSIIIGLPFHEVEDEKYIKSLNLHHDDNIDLTRLCYLRKIQNTFEDEYQQYIEDDLYFYACSFKVYKKTYLSRLKEFQNRFIDADEIDFINQEYISDEVKYINSYESIESLSLTNVNDYSKNKSYSFKKRNEFLENRIKELGYEINHFNDDNFPYFSSVSITKKQTTKPNQLNSINWKGTQTEIIELVKALIENGSVQGKQKDIINDFSLFFDTQIKNPDKTIQDIKNRNNGSETLFIDSIKTSLLNYLKK